eukprot:XP_001703415.1 ubiquitin fusion degradation protein [Chlamydomonas reinhardtii]
MMSFELNARANRLLAEQKARADKEKARIEKERVLAERQRQRELAREQEAQQRRQQQLEAEQRAQDAEFERREANRGVYLRLELAALPTDEAAVAAKGVRRSKDKIILPPSAGSLLMSQDASKNGAMLFEVALPAAASVPDPSPAPSTSAPAASTSATGTSSTAAGVPGRTHAGVLEFTAPEGCALEAEMMTLSTLSEGDWITVHQPDTGREWPLRVQELLPAAAVSVLDTDLAADVVPSLEAEEYLARWEEDQRRQQERLAAAAAERAEQEAAEAAFAARRQAEEAAAAAAAAAEQAALQARLAASLPPEPEAAASTSDSGAVFAYGGCDVTLGELGLGAGGGGEAFLLEAVETPRAAAGTEGAGGSSSMEVCS